MKVWVHQIMLDNYNCNLPNSSKPFIIQIDNVTKELAHARPLMRRCPNVVLFTKYQFVAKRKPLKIIEFTKNCKPRHAKGTHFEHKMERKRRPKIAFYC